MDLFASMEAFCRVVESGSLGKAATHLGISKSMVARRVDLMEQRLGAPLFHRSARAMSLTEAGRRCYLECVEVLSRVEEMQSRRDPSGEGGGGRLAIQVLPGFAHGGFSEVVVEFSVLHPRIALDITVSDQLVDPVREGLDVVFQIYPAVSDALVERRLFRHRGAFCSAPGYMASAPPLMDPEDLGRHRFARYSNYPWGDRWPLTGRDGLTEVTVPPALITNNVLILLAYALNGAGIAYLPTVLAAPYVRSGELVQVLAGYAPPQLWMSAVYPTSHRSTARLKTFLDFVARRFPSEPPWDAVFEPEP